MVDFSALGQGDVGGFIFGGQDPAGLLSPQQQKGVNQDAMLGLAAGLLQAGGPSPYPGKLRWGSDLGSGLAAGLKARQEAQGDAVKQSYVRAQMFDKLVPLQKMMLAYEQAGQPAPAWLKQELDTVHRMAGIGSMSGTPAAAGAVPGGGGGDIGGFLRNLIPGMGGGGAGIGAGVPGSPGPSPAGTAPGLVGADGGSGAAPAGIPNIFNQAGREKGFNMPGIYMGLPGSEAQTKAIGETLHARDPDIARAKRNEELDKAEIADSQKAAPAFYAMGQTGRSMIEDARLSQSLAKDKGFYSGAFQPFVEAWNSLKVASGVDPNATFSMQAFRKILASNMNTAIADMRSMAAQMGGAAGRIFERQARMIEAASQSLGNSPAANAFLANMQERMGRQHVAMSRMAIDYMKEHRVLDAGFYDKLDAFLEKNPLFSDEELKDARKLIPKTDASATDYAPIPTNTAPAQAGAAPVPGAIGSLGAGGGDGAAPALPSGPGWRVVQ